MGDIFGFGSSYGARGASAATLDPGVLAHGERFGGQHQGLVVNIIVLKLKRALRGHYVSLKLRPPVSGRSQISPGEKLM
jgi:hypothetical protein